MYTLNVILIYATFINLTVGIETTNFRDVKKERWAGKKFGKSKQEVLVIKHSKKIFI